MSPPAASTDRDLPWATLAVLWPAYVFSIFSRGFLTVLAGDLERDLGLGPADLGAVGSAWFVVFAAAQFPVGYALDHWGPRRTVSLCMVLGVAGVALFALATGFWSAFSGMALMGLGCAPIFMGSLYIIAKVVSPERFGGVVSVFIGLGSAGNLLGATPLTLATEIWGWRNSMLAIGAAFALTTALVALVVRDPARSVSETPNEGVWQGLASIMRIGPLWVLMPLVLVGYAALATERGLWVAPFFGAVHGLDKLGQGNAALAMAVAMTVGALLFGTIERLSGGQKQAVALSTAVVVAAFAILALSGAARAEGAVQALALIVVIGFFGFNYGSLMAHARLFFPEHLIGRGMTFVNFGFIAGSAALQYGSGRFIQSARDAGQTPADHFASLHLGFAAILAVALAIYLFAPARPHPARAA